jgi:hypothetical protein
VEHAVAEQWSCHRRLLRLHGSRSPGPASVVA